MILDIPEADRKTLAGFFSYRISEGNFRNIRFSFDGAGEAPRVSLKGDAGEVVGLVDACREMAGRFAKAPH